MIGRLLDGRYRIIQALGSGGFGHTYTAEDTKRPGNPICVLKHLSFSSNDSAILKQVRRMFVAEAETLERLGRHDQIPQLLAYFEEDEEFYLVQEFVEGHALSQELSTGQPKTEDWVIAFLQDVLKTLEFVHAQGVLHRDLKPENLIRRDRDQKLVLIDFGAVKNIGTTLLDSDLETTVSVPVYTSGYAASEQCLGRPQIASDLYSIGAIAIQALTGVRPSQLQTDPNTCELQWRDRATVRDSVATVIETLTKFHFAERYQSAAQALQALEFATEDELYTKAPLSKLEAMRSQVALIQDTVPTRSPKPVVLATLGVSAASIIGVSTWALTRPMTQPSAIVATPSPVFERISSGNKVLTPAGAAGTGGNLPQKQEAADQFDQGNYDRAIELLKDARKADKNDPETLIYLNNARIKTEKSYTIAVVIPLKTQPVTSMEVLRGVAQAQEQVNQLDGINGVKLKVAIATDDSNPDLARRIAKALADDPSVLGVVGHGTSDTTIAAGEVYRAQQLVAISPISSATQLAENPYTLRTMPSDQRPARALADHMLNRLKKKKAAIFYNSNNKYSTSLKDAFKDALYFSGKGSSLEIDMSSPFFGSPSEKVETVIQQGAEVLFLAPNAEWFDRSMLILAANRKRLPVLAGDTMYDPRLLNNGTDPAGVSIAVPFYQLELEQSNFQKQSRSLWGAAVNWRSALAYDATQSFITALKRSTSRNGIHTILTKPDFVSAGALHAVTFSQQGDRETKIALMQVTSAPSKSKKSAQYEFKPIDK